VIFVERLVQETIEVSWLEVKLSMVVDGLFVTVEESRDELVVVVIVAAIAPAAVVVICFAPLLFPTHTSIPTI